MNPMKAYRRRHAAPTLRRTLATFPAVAVTGSRQVGKTTLLRQELAVTHRFVSLELPSTRERAKSDPTAFFVENPPPIVLDEIQYVPELLHEIKVQIDADRSPGRFVLSGSQSFPLMQGVAQTLAGRVAVLSLGPLSVSETVGALPPDSIDALLDRVFGAPSVHESALRPAIPDAADWLLRGGYPEIRLDPAVDRQLWFASYAQTYLERDVRDLLQVGDLHDFGRFVALIAGNSGRQLNFSDLAREIGVSGPTAKRWLSVLEASQIVRLLKPFHRNYGKRITKAPKVVLSDPGLATALIGLHQAEALVNGPSFGALFETAVIGEWVKAFCNAGEPPPFHFWRTSAGHEVDLVFERNHRLYGIEIKSTATPTPRHAESLAQWLELAGPSARAVLACNVAAPMTLRPGIRAVPWHLAW